MENITVTEPAQKRKVYENPVIGDKAIFLETSHETNGAYTLIEVEVAPGGGNALHIHHNVTEIFSIIEGKLQVQSGKETKQLKAGEAASIPPKTVHCFQNTSDKPVKFRVKLIPGHEGFEQSLKIGYGLASEGLTYKNAAPKNFAHLALCVTLSDTNLTGIYSLLMPVLRWKARQAQKRGILQELMNRYCR